MGAKRILTEFREKMIIFLDFDGVLHSNEVYKNVNKPIALLGAGHLCMHAEILEELIKPYSPDIVQSTSS